MAPAVLAEQAAMAGGAASVAWLVPALPAAGALLLLLAGRRSDRWGHLLGCLTAVASFGVGVALLVQMLGQDASARSADHVLFAWVPAGALHIDFGLRIDPLSLCFVLLITGVGSLIHLYSVGYMAHGPDPAGRFGPGKGRRLFFAYLNLFLAAMLVLVLSDNYLGLYLGWEGVGLASYLLIGFWQYRPSAATAAKKAFVVNRVGDMGMVIAMMVMFAAVGSVGFGDVFGAAGGMGEGTVTAIGLLLVVAACAKSAQVPLQSWLGDAMEGPTPVSALIHAATMVTAGVYLIVRSGPLFDLSEGARAAALTVGTVTVLFGAVIGCAKDDIKKALAASTMSQIGYMVLAAGLGPAGYAVAILHLLTHGFFKAGLFLGAGSVMHAMHDEVDMRRLGGLRAFMPITFVTFGLGYLAIIGIPPFSGFFSKDKIIEAAFAHGGAAGAVLGIAAIAGAGLTAFYMTRVMLMTFFGERRWRPTRVEATGEVTMPEPAEAPSSMTVPMIVLALGSIFAGGALTLGDRLERWLAPVVGDGHASPPIPAWSITVITLLVVLAGVGVAYRAYALREVPGEAPADVSPVTAAARRDLYGDAFNEAVFMRPGAALTDSLDVVERRGIDRVVEALAAAAMGVSALVRHAQTGFVRNYALTMFAGAVLLLAIVVLGRM